MENKNEKKADKCETVKELKTVQNQLDEVGKIDLPAYKTPNLVAAILQVMDQVKNIEKNSTVGVGQNAFNAVSDKDVKFKVGQAMTNAGLVVVPISVEPTAHVERFPDPYNEKKRKKEVFTEVKTKYLLMHESGEKIEFAGYGQGVDSQDKSAGKATTYALKYALLYLFMIPTGTIADADKTQPGKPQEKKQTLNADQFQKALDAIEKGDYTKEKLQSDYALSADQIEKVK